MGKFRTLKTVFHFADLRAGAAGGGEDGEEGPGAAGADEEGVRRGDEQEEGQGGGCKYSLFFFVSGIGKSQKKSFLK